MNINKKQLSSEQAVELINVLKARFEKNMNRQNGKEQRYRQCQAGINKVAIVIAIKRGQSKPFV